MSREWRIWCVKIDAHTPSAFIWRENKSLVDQQKNIRLFSHLNISSESYIYHLSVLIRKPYTYLSKIKIARANLSIASKLCQQFKLSPNPWLHISRQWKHKKRNINFMSTNNKRVVWSVSFTLQNCFVRLTSFTIPFLVFVFVYIFFSHCHFPLSTPFEIFGSQSPINVLHPRRPAPVDALFALFFLTRFLRKSSFPIIAILTVHDPLWRSHAKGKQKGSMLTCWAASSTTD